MVNYAFNFADLEYFLLIFVRITCFIYIAPFLSMTNTPNRVKIGLGLFLTYLIDQSLPHEEIAYATLLEFTIMVMKEAVTGFIIGFGANLCTTIVSFAGHIADMETGLSMATIFDPTTNQQTSISGVYYQYVVMLLLLVSGLHQYIVSALVETFEIIPINGAVFHIDSLLDTMVNFLSSYIIIGFRIALPVFAVILIVNAVLGVLAKVSPQMNMFAVGIQIKLLVGLSVLFLTTGMMPSAANFIFEQMKIMMVSFVEGMRP